MKFENPTMQTQPAPESSPRNDSPAENDLSRADELLSANRALSPSEAKFLRSVGEQDPEGRRMEAYRNKKAFDAIDGRLEDQKTFAEASTLQEEQDKKKAQEILDAIQGKSEPEASEEYDPEIIPPLKGYSPEKYAAVSALYKTLISVAEKMGERPLLGNVQQLIRENPGILYIFDEKLNRSNIPFTPDRFDPEDPDDKETLHKFFARAANDGNFDAAIQEIAA